MPKDITDKLNRAFVEAMKDPEVIKKMASQDFALTPSTPEALGVLVKRQIDVYREIARVAGLQPE
jgi:tripartite-type tricarboxylate transporter receptor subunit TctC